MHQRNERDREPRYDDPDAFPWTALALLVIFILLCLIIVARVALAVLAS
jgi:hypothetical protein